MPIIYNPIGGGADMRDFAAALGSALQSWSSGNVAKVLGQDWRNPNLPSKNIAGTPLLVNLVQGIQKLMGAKDWYKYDEKGVVKYLTSKDSPGQGWMPVPQGATTVDQTAAYNAKPQYQPSQQDIISQYGVQPSRQVSSPYSQTPPMGATPQSTRTTSPFGYPAPQQPKVIPVFPTQSQGAPTVDLLKAMLQKLAPQSLQIAGAPQAMEYPAFQSPPSVIPGDNAQILEQLNALVGGPTQVQDTQPPPANDSGQMVQQLMAQIVQLLQSGNNVQRNYGTPARQFHSGGPVSDMVGIMKLDRGEVPAILEKGEVVINKRAASAVGRNKLNNLNKQIPRYHGGTGAPQPNEEKTYTTPDNPGWPTQFAEAVKSALRTTENVWVPGAIGVARTVVGKPVYSADEQALMMNGELLPGSSPAGLAGIPNSAAFVEHPPNEGVNESYGVKNLTKLGATKDNTWWVPMNEASPEDRTKAFQYNGKPMFFRNQRDGKYYMPIDLSKMKKAAPAPTVVVPPKVTPPGPIVPPAPVVPPTVAAPAELPLVESMASLFGTTPGTPAPSPSVPDVAYRPEGGSLPIDQKLLASMDPGTAQEYLQKIANTQGFAGPWVGDPNSVVPREQQLFQALQSQYATGGEIDLRKAQTEMQRANAVSQTFNNNFDAMTAKAKAAIVYFEYKKAAINDWYSDQILKNKTYEDPAMQKDLLERMKLQSQINLLDAQTKKVNREGGSGKDAQGTMTGYIQFQKEIVTTAQRMALSTSATDIERKEYYRQYLKYMFMLNPVTITQENDKVIADRYNKQGNIFGGGKMNVTAADVANAKNDVIASQYYQLFSKTGGPTSNMINPAQATTAAEPLVPVQ